MIALWIAGILLVVSAFFLFGVPMMVLGPRMVMRQTLDRPEGRLMLGMLTTAAIGLVMLPFSAAPLISAGDIAHMSVENFHRLHWTA